MSFFGFTIQHTFVLPGDSLPLISRADLDALEKRIMSQISDQITALQASTDAMASRVTTQLAELKSEIDKLSTNAATPENLAALAELKTKIDAVAVPTPAA